MKDYHTISIDNQPRNVSPVLALIMDALSQDEEINRLLTLPFDKQRLEINRSGKSIRWSVTVSK